MSFYEFLGEEQMARNMIWLALKFQDKREVFMITSVHEFEYAQTGKIDFHQQQDKVKPSLVIDYNKNMGSVDLIDKQLSLIESIRIHEVV